MARPMKLDEEVYKTTFGYILRRIRIFEDLNIKQAAAKLSLTDQTYRIMEWNKIPVSDKTLKRIFRVFKVCPELQKEMSRRAPRYSKSVRIDTPKNVSFGQGVVMAQFINSFYILNNEQLQAIQSILTQAKGVGFVNYGDLEPMSTVDINNYLIKTYAKEINE